MVHYFKFTLAIFNFNCLTLKLIEKIEVSYFSNNSSPIILYRQIGFGLLLFSFILDFGFSFTSLTRPNRILIIAICKTFRKILFSALAEYLVLLIKIPYSLLCMNFLAFFECLLRGCSKIKK